MLTGYKSIVQSRTFWTNLFNIAVLVAGALGYQVSDADQKEVVVGVAGVVATVGNILAIVFRVKATKQIGAPENPVGSIR